MRTALAWTLLLLAGTVYRVTGGVPEAGVAGSTTGLARRS